MIKLAGNLPSHELIYREIRGMILFGELKPGQAVTIHGLVDALGTGVTPVREAIRRLMAEGALEFQGNRRICLPTLTPALLDEISFARSKIEPRLAYLATSLVNSTDIDRLQEIDATLNVAIAQGDVHGYLENNFWFHEALYAHSNAPVLMSITRTLWLRISPSLRVVCGRFGTANLPDKHQEALAGLRDGDASSVASAIAEDIQQGHDGIRSTWDPHGLKNSD